MVHSICIIDDSIPLGDEKLFIDDTGRLNSSNIELLLSQEDIKWEDDVKELFIKLVKDKESWSVSAFRNPNIYLNNFDKELYLPDFIVFDWDYGKTTDPTEELLKEVLEKSFSLISIYTRSDEKESVEKIIEEDFKEYRNRITLIIKSDENSQQKLMDWANELLINNFSFRFSKELRDHAHNSLENILIDFGKPTINDIVWLFGDEDEEHKRFFHTKDLSDIIAEKLRNELLTKNLGSELKSVAKEYIPSASLELIKKMWSYRLYYSPKDDIIRKGDILKKTNSDDNSLFLVISSDCHLKSFWKRNFGYLTIIPLYKINKDNYNLLSKLDLYKRKSDLKGKDVTPSSLTNLSGFAEGITIIPCIPLKNSFIDYILFPKEIFSIEIPVPELQKSNKRNLALKYEYIVDYDKKDRITISEPFITPLVEHILYNISGYGVPDYPKSLQKEISNNFKGIFE